MADFEEPAQQSEAARRSVSRALQGPGEADVPPQALPIVSTVNGVEFINVPLAHYLELQRQAVESCGSSETAPVSVAQRAAHVGSPIYLDHEVADLLYAEVGRLTIEQARAACRERFGTERTPSRSAIHRYWLRVRQGLDRHGARGGE